jgi:WD40 repeat protein
VLPASIGIRAVESLDLIRTIKLPANLAASVTTFIWSASSERILLATADEIHVVSATGAAFHATIRNPLSAAAKSTFVDFGATDGEAFVISAHGIKLSLFNLTSSRVLEIANPKFYTTSSAARGFSFRPYSRHLALLSRTLGKDTISVHAPDTREVLRSWSPDIVDAQGLAWTPDGRWLVVWESAAQGHRVVFFTPDGHRYRDWRGSQYQQQHESGIMHGALGPGVRLVALSPDSKYVAIGDYGRCVYVLHTSNMTTQLQLLHPSTAEPKDTLQVWYFPASPTSPKSDTLLLVLTAVTIRYGKSRWRRRPTRTRSAQASSGPPNR